jgi:two-component system, OmpR family, phosphate regulon sensor histidine kinase PhoR
MSGSRIQRRLFAVLVTLVASVVVFAAIFQGSRVGSDVKANLQSSLTRQARMLAAELDRSPPADLSEWAHRVPADARVTVIGADGRVLADSSVPSEGLNAVENHAARPEVVAALQHRVGADMRRSATVGHEYLYVAVPCPGEREPRVLRLAIPLDEVSQVAWRAQGAIWLAGLIAVVVAVMLAAVIARWLTRSLTGMTRAARAMTKGDFEVALPNAGDDELGDLVHALDTLRQQLAARIDELKGEGEKLRTILNGMSEGVALMQETTLLVVNRAFATFIGAGRDIEGRTLLESARLPELADLIARGGEGELQIGGRTLLVSTQAIGKPGLSQVLVILVDMSEPRRLERMRRDFVANASHELRTPVAAILGAAETLAHGAADDPEARASFVDILLRHAQRLKRLTADLLDIARLEAGYKPHVESIDAAPVVQSVIGSLQARADEKKIALSTSVGGERVSAERAAVEQVLTNLVENAIKYTPEGGTVSVSSASDGSVVRLTVEDTGPGILPEHLPRLWERFYRVDDARSREMGGTGLGLSIVKHLVMANGGDVKVDSTVGKGTRFVVSLPRA